MPATSTTRATRTKNDPTAAFFTDLASRGHEPLLERASGSIRFDIAEGRGVDHWFVRIRKGDVSVANKDAKADVIVQVDKAFFDRLTQGRENAMAASLRGVLTVKGDLSLVILFQRIFPGPPRSRAGTRSGGPGKAKR